MAQISLTGNQKCFQIENEIVTAYYDTAMEDIGGARFVIKETTNPLQYLGKSAAYLESGTTPPTPEVTVPTLRSRAEVLFHRSTFLNEINDPDKEIVQIQYAQALTTYQEASGQPSEPIVIAINTNVNSITVERNVPSQEISGTIVWSDGENQPFPEADWILSSGLTREGNRVMSAEAGNYEVRMQRDSVLKIIPVQVL